MTDTGAEQLPAPPVWSSDIHPSQPWRAVESVLRTAGARPAKRDPIDARIIRSVIDGTGSIIDSQEQVGGYPMRAQSARAVTVPDGSDARRKWLDGLSRDLEEDATLDLGPLWKRMGVARTTERTRPSFGREAKRFGRDVL